MALERDSRGRFFLVASDNHGVVVFDSTGRQLRRIGRMGDGPGEFGRPGILYLRMGPGDTLHVFHSRSRLSLFSPSLTFVRSVDLRALLGNPGPYPHILRDGSMLVAARILSPQLAGIDFHILEKNGVIRRSFDRFKQPSSNQRIPFPPNFGLARDQQSVWTVEDTAYTFEQINLDGKPGRKFEVYDVPWFRPNVKRDTLIGKVPRQIVDVLTSVEVGTVDDNGLLWLQGYARSSRDLSGARTNRVEIFDTRRGEILVSQVLPTDFDPHFIHDTDLVYTANISSDGLATAVVYRIKLVRN